MADHFMVGSFFVVESECPMSLTVKNEISKQLPKNNFETKVKLIIRLTQTYFGTL